MILKDDLLKYIPLQWTLIHPNMYALALEAKIKELAELAMVETHIDNQFYWRRFVDNSQLELGL